MLLHQLCHLVADGDRLLVQLILANFITLLIRIVKDSFQFSLTLGIDDIPEVLLVALSTLVDLRWKVWFDFFSLRELNIKRLDRYLRVVAHVYPLDIGLEKQFLLAT